MAKHDRRKTSGQPPSSQPVTIQVPLPVLGVINGVREAFHGLCIATGLQVLEAMMEADREALCGPKGRHQVERPAWRGGSVDSQVTLGGRQVEVPRRRVRSAEGEVPLASFQWAASTDPLDEHTLAAVAAGVSTRRYASTLDPVPAEVNERATSSSAVSRRFVALSTKRLHAFLSRPLGDAGPAGGVHRRQGVPGPLHGDRVGHRHTGPETRAGPARRRHRNGGRHDRSAQRPGDAGPADRPDVAVLRRWRGGAAPGHHRRVRFSRRGATLPSTQVQERARTSSRAAARVCQQGVAGCVESRFGGPRGAGAGAAGRVSGTRPSRRRQRPSGRDSRRH